jgi:hemolysin activation/secretion protein
VKNSKQNMMVLLTVFLLLVFCQTGWAADPYSGAAPGAVEKSLQQEKMPKQVQLPRIEVADEKTGTLKGGEGVTFELKGITFEGNKAIPTEELNQAVESYVDKTIKVNDLQVIADKVTSYYIEKGYILTRAYLPPQTIKDGRVLIRVRYGELGKIIVKGNERYKKEIIENVISIMKQKGAVKTTDMERALLLLMDYPGLSVKATLTAG